MTLNEWKHAIDLIAEADGRGKNFCQTVLINEGMHGELTPEKAYHAECVGLDSL